jgi:hypothetical protein
MLCLLKRADYSMQILAWLSYSQVVRKANDKVAIVLVSIPASSDTVNLRDGK